jgi:hypothetical protein
MAITKAQLLLKSMDDFYSIPENAATFKDIVSGTKGGVSLRSIERFITSYSKNTNFCFKTIGGTSFPVHLKYKSTLDGYSKKLFDPFARYERIEYTVPATGEKVMTTVAQLNFLRWAIKNGIVNYIRSNPTVTKNS